MARRTLQQGITDGILSTGHLAQLTGFSIACVQQICDGNLIDCVRLPGSKERRIPVNERLESYLIANSYGFSLDLITAKENYYRRYKKPTDLSVKTDQAPGTPTFSPESVDREIRREQVDPVLEASSEPEPLTKELQNGVP